MKTSSTPCSPISARTESKCRLPPCEYAWPLARSTDNNCLCWLCSTGFEFEEGNDGEVIVSKVRKRSLASKVEHACEGMILYSLTSGSGRKKKTILIEDGTPSTCSQ